MSVLDDPRHRDAFLVAFHAGTPSRQIAHMFPVSKSTVNTWRQHGLPGSIEAPANVVKAEPGGSEEHRPDGSADYVRFSETPWGYEDHRDFIRSKGQDPDKVTFTWGLTTRPGGGFWNKLNNVRPIAGIEAEATNDIDLPALYAEVKRTTYSVRRPTPDTGRTTVVVWADMQLGKVGSRGDTAGLIERLTEKRAALVEYLETHGTDRNVFIDAGDPIEGFENVAMQMFTNDLSLPQQVDMAAVEMWKTLALLSQFGPVDSVAVPSNHGAWRAGKQSLGKPSDDWGIGIQNRLKFQTELVGMDVTFHKPTDWDESVALDVRGTKLGVHHGHQAACDQMPKWWAGQQHGAQATADADVLVTGHYHHLRVQPTGRSQRTGKSKWWLQAPTLDQGSDWYRNRAGDDSDPGLLVFQINDQGFDLQSLAVL